MGTSHLCKSCLLQEETFETIVTEQIFNAILAKTQDKSFWSQISFAIQMPYDLS